MTVLDVLHVLLYYILVVQDRHQNKHATIAIELGITHRDKHRLVVYKSCSNMDLQASALNQHATRWADDEQEPPSSETQQRRLVSAIARGPNKHQSFPLFKEASANW